MVMLPLSRLFNQAFNSKGTEIIIFILTSFQPMKKYFFLAALLCGTSLASQAASAPDIKLPTPQSIATTNGARVVFDPLLCATVHACGGTGVACGYGQAGLDEAVGIQRDYMCSKKQEDPAPILT